MITSVQKGPKVKKNTRKKENKSEKVDKTSNDSTKGGKVALKRELLQKLCQQIEAQKGVTPSLNEAIITAAQSFLDELQLNFSHKAKIKEAAAVAKMHPQQILDKACSWASRFYLQKYSKEDSVDKNLPAGGERDGHHEFSPGSAYARIGEFVKELMKKNDLAKKKEDKVFINQTYLVKNQGSNRDAIKGFLHLQKEMLDKHHKKHSLGPRHNVEVNSYLSRMGE